MPGRPRLYPSAAARQAAYRARKRNAAERDDFERLRARFGYETACRLVAIGERFGSAALAAAAAACTEAILADRRYPGRGLGELVAQLNQKDR